MQQRVMVDQPRTRLDAELRRGALESEGVRVTLATDDAGGMHPHLGPSVAAIRLFVPAEEADRARQLLAELDAGTHELSEG